LFRYGNFLLKIIHNEYEALECYDRAKMIFLSRINKRGNAMPINEQTIFGENSATGIVIISATSTKIGIVIHANEEVEQILGYNRKDIIGKNVAGIMPRPIAKVHDKLI
jgi:PAS domain-containing protein